MSGALLVAGTASDAGKSVVVAGLCRWLSREGVAVAPYKAQNMSLNSMVTRDGGEIGRAQAMQAAAARVEAEAAMNPVLLKPGGDTRSQVVVLGEPIGEVGAIDYREVTARLLDTVLDCLADLRARFDVVVCEGAGSPAEVNLRGRDIANMGLARAAGLPVLVVGDIDRGGVLAAMFGTLALLSAEDQALVAGFVVNKFRGDPALLAPGLDMLRALTGRPSYGVLPFLPGLWLDAEDSLDLEHDRGEPLAPLGQDVLRVAVVRLPRMSNVTDADALASEPGVVVRLVTHPEELADADLVVLPGSRATVRDLAWLRIRRLDAALRERAARGGQVLGICGGYQMLGATIEDDVESGAGRVKGLGLLPVRTSFGREKVLALPEYDLPDGTRVRAYEIHHGRVERDGGEPFVGPEGCVAGPVAGTVLHGVLENDDFRRSYLRSVASATGRRFVVSPSTSFAAQRERRLDALGDLVADHLDTSAVWRLLESGPPRGLPFVPPGTGAP